MKTCATCIYWMKLGECATARRILYDNRQVSIAPGPEGQCRAAPPSEDNRWPLTMGGDWCGCHQGAEHLTEATTPRASAAGETSTPPAPDSAESKDETLADSGKGSLPVKPAEASASGGPPSLLSRFLPGRGHGRGGRQR